MFLIRERNKSVQTSGSLELLEQKEGRTIEKVAFLVDVVVVRKIGRV